MIRSRNLLGFAVLAGLVVLALMGPRSVTQAQDAPDGEMTPNMVRFLEDVMAPQPLASAALEPCVNGLADIYPCENIDLLSFTPLAEFGSSAGNDIWGWTDSTTGGEYAIMGTSDGTVFVDITDPINPVYLGKLPTHTSNSSWRDIKVYADHAFVVSEAGGHGMQIFDLTQLRSVASPPATFSNTAHFSGFGSAHNVVINEDSGYAYGVGAGTCAGGLHMVDISTPTSPVDAGCFSADGYTHDAQCVIYDGPDADHVGSEICINSNEDTITVVDVTNKNSPVQLSRTGYAGSSYTHQGWLTDDQVYFLLDDETDEQSAGHNTRTRIFDMTDLDAPQFVGFHDADNPAIDHNLYVVGDLVYQANYRSGLRILSLADIANGNLEELAFFDIFPSSDSAAFNGAWSVYPFFESGNVIVSGIEQGLFVLEPTTTASFNMVPDETTLSACVTGSPQTVLNLQSILGFSDPVTLSDTGLPTGANATYSDNPVNPPGTSNLTVNVTTAAAGEYPFTVTGTAGTISDTVDLHLSVHSATPSTTTLSTPANGATDIGFQPTLSWAAATEGQSYLVELATDMGISAIVYSTTTDATSVMVPVILTGETDYYWRVTAGNSCGAAAPSSVFSFTTQADETLFCDGPAVTFAQGIPAGWDVIDNTAGAGIVWTTVNDPACGIGNQTGGSGNAACADSDASGSGSPPFDTELVTDMFNVSGATFLTLNFNGYYRDLGSGNDSFGVDMWNGSEWLNQMTWDETHPAEAVAVDVIVAGLTDVQFRFTYSGDGFDWYAQVDDVSLSCSTGVQNYLPIIATP